MLIHRQVSVLNPRLQGRTELQHNAIGVKEVERAYPGFLRRLRPYAGFFASDHVVMVNHLRTINTLGHQLLAVVVYLICCNIERNMMQRRKAETM